MQFYNIITSFGKDVFKVQNSQCDFLKSHKAYEMLIRKMSKKHHFLRFL
jgi:hypothetical protein